VNAPSETPGTRGAPAAPSPTSQKPSRPKSARRRSRELALQGLYEWQISHAEARVVHAHIREQDEYNLCDSAHFDALLSGCIEQVAMLDAELAPHLDRKVTELSPVEHGVLLIGTYELQHCLDVPYRVVINEAVELAKVFGGTDGHKFVNGVLDRTAKELRAAEVAAYRPAPRKG
jgi:N utilization substance protein B